MSYRIVGLALVWALFVAGLALRQHNNQPVAPTGPIIWSTSR